MEITEVFESYYRQYEKIDLAEDNFREALEEDSDLKQQYVNWCEEMGYTERKGFKSYFMNKAETDNIWDSIYPNREELDGYDFDR